MDNPIRFIDSDGMSSKESLGAWMTRKQEEDKIKFAGASSMEGQMMATSARRQREQDQEQEAEQENAERQAENNVAEEKTAQQAVILDVEGNIKSFPSGANAIYVDVDGNLVPFRQGLARKNGPMSRAAFSNALTNILEGTVMPDDELFDRNKLHNGRVSIAFSGTETYNDGRYGGEAASTRFENHKMVITFKNIGGNLTVDAVRSILGYHEYYAHGILRYLHSRDRNKPIDAEIDRIEKSYFTDGRNR